MKVQIEKTPKLYSEVEVTLTLPEHEACYLLSALTEYLESNDTELEFVGENGDLAAIVDASYRLYLVERLRDALQEYIK